MPFTASYPKMLHLEEDSCEITVKGAAPHIKRNPVGMGKSQRLNNIDI
jgi:hypothetical protein